MEAIKSSVYASLANELEINKALELIRQGKVIEDFDLFIVFFCRKYRASDRGFFSFS